MPRSRGLFTAALVVLILLVVYVLLRPGGGLSIVGPQPSALPVDLQKIIPASWTLLPDQPLICNFDDDEDTEWLLLYRYDNTTLTDIYRSGNKPVERGPIGGVVYDAQMNLIPQDPGNLSPYRPAFLVPYKLLPDFYADKGQGYLGETHVEFRGYARSQEGATGCRAEELYFLGYSDSPLPVRLSIFRWAGREVGYRGVHFIGNARVTAPGAGSPTQQIEQVTTYNRLNNHRSLLCEVRHFQRPAGSTSLEFQEDFRRFTIDFCYEPPSDPVYPEAALIALLRGANPRPLGDQAGPTGSSYLTRNAQLAPELVGLRSEERAPIRVLSVTNQGTVTHAPGMGAPCEAAQVQPTASRWWCAVEETLVEAEIILNDRFYRATARLISIANEQVTTSIHWRVTSLDLP